MATIAFIGLGRMGLPMCARLAAAGYQLTAADVRPQQEMARRAGARWASSPAAAAAEADIVLTMLPGPGEVREAMTGAGGVLEAMRPGTIWLDTSSNSPAVGRELAEAAHARGILTLDAPVGGGIAAAHDGKLHLFVGGDTAVLERCRPVLEALAARITHLGGDGAGYTAKLLVNLLWFTQALATAEALLLARRAGMNVDILRAGLAESAASSTFVREDLGSLLDGDYLTTFGLDRCCEELAEITALARELNVPNDLARHVESTYQRALRRFGPIDGELLGVALLEEQAGLRLRHESRERAGPGTTPPGLSGRPWVARTESGPKEMTAHG
ncbi:MAG TPA: NAD(P)-dependent oxidoreductase [Streptosporangiaceae bacterium]|jgi:3-hydroxyisobutyrate dehydrogenase|nr:NAD(P)-dependent oxidoreductase [Streptosporangiaceae bacterium]